MINYIHRVQKRYRNIIHNLHFKELLEINSLAINHLIPLNDGGDIGVMSI